MTIEFENSYRSTRSGFAHDTRVSIGSQYIHRTTCHYLNRTWESYAYQSVMKQAMYEMIELEKARLKAEYKRQTGKKRVSKDMVFTSEFMDQLIAKKDSL